MKTSAFLLTLLAASARAFVPVNPPGVRAIYPLRSSNDTPAGSGVQGEVVEKTRGEPSIIVDDECYTGKDGQLDECADFDPPKVPAADNSPPEVDVDSPTGSGVQGKVVEKTRDEPSIVVDDECYTGKDGQLDECADFDPVTK